MQNAMPSNHTDETMTDSDASLSVGTLIADFEIIGVVGEGGFGIVYLAVDRSLQRTVAIKEYMPRGLARRGADNSVVVRSQSEQETFNVGLSSFLKEARLLARFDHPALIKVHRFWEENRTGYMAMQYYEGHTVKGIIKNHPQVITEAWLKAMLASVLDALEALYRVQVLHRDISPDNIMIQNSGEAVLLDFGAARQIISDMNHAVTVVLKPGYAPIEQYANDASIMQGPWTDIYSLSAVVYFAIAKKPPPLSVIRVIKDPIEWLQGGQHEGYSEAFLAAIDKGLAVKPEERPQSIEEFRQLLRLESTTPRGAMSAANVLPLSVASGAVETTSFDDSLPTPSKVKESSKRMYVLTVTAVLSGLGIAGYSSLNQEIPSAAVASDQSGQSAHAQPAQAGVTVKARLNIKPWGTVFVDGVSKGVSPPLKELDLAEGTHKVKIENPNFRSHTIEINVSKENTTFIEYDFSPK